MLVMPDSNSTRMTCLVSQIDLSCRQTYYYTHRSLRSLLLSLVGMNAGVLCGLIVGLVSIAYLSLGGDALVFLCVFEFGGFRARTRSRRMSLQVFNRISRVLQKIA